jgi:hypothetical protein
VIEASSRVLREFVRRAKKLKNGDFPRRNAQRARFARFNRGAARCLPQRAAGRCGGRGGPRPASCPRRASGTPAACSRSAALRSPLSFPPSARCASLPSPVSLRSPFGPLASLGSRCAPPATSALPPGPKLVPLPGAFAALGRPPSRPPRVRGTALAGRAAAAPPVPSPRRPLARFQPPSAACWRSRSPAARARSLRSLAPVSVPFPPRLRRPSRPLRRGGGSRRRPAAAPCGRSASAPASPRGRCGPVGGSAVVPLRGPVCSLPPGFASAGRSERPPGRPEPFGGRPGGPLAAWQPRTRNPDWFPLGKSEPRWRSGVVPA